MLNEWFDIIRQNQDAVNMINKYLDNVQYPHTFNRRPRDLSSFNKWKASELRTCFMYPLVPILIKLTQTFPDSFPNVYVSHFICLYIYIRVLRHYENHADISHMPIFIHTYLKHYASLYPGCKELLSTHSLIHLWQQVKYHGALAYHR